MSSNVQILNQESTLTAATNVQFATLVRILNSGTAALVTQKTSEGDVLASFTMNANEIIYLRKVGTDTLEGGAAFKVNKVSYGW
jgi:hypothetical protein